MFFHWLSLSNGLILDLDDSYNTVFKADNTDKPCCGLKQCYTDGSQSRNEEIKNE